MFFRWALALGYVGFIYATLGVIRNVTNIFRNLGILGLLVTAGYVLVSGIFLLKLTQSKTRQWWRYVSLAAAIAAYFFWGKDIPTPEEKIHFFEYGFVGILFFRALALHFKNKTAVWSGAFILGSLAGWADELIQGVTPGRYYDVKDIQLNVLSVGLGLLLFTLPPEPANSVSSGDAATTRI